MCPSSSSEQGQAHLEGYKTHQGDFPYTYLNSIYYDIIMRRVCVPLWFFNAYRKSEKNAELIVVVKLPIYGSKITSSTLRTLSIVVILDSQISLTQTFYPNLQILLTFPIIRYICFYIITSFSKVSKVRQVKFKSFFQVYADEQNNSHVWTFDYSKNSQSFWPLLDFTKW
jgi:hypothetical protein